MMETPSSGQLPLNITPCTTQSKKRNYKKRSPIHTHSRQVDLDGQIYLFCNYCITKYIYSGSTKNMLDHIKTTHPEYLENIEINENSD